MAKENNCNNIRSPLLTADETAKYMRVSKQSLYNSRSKNSRNKFPVKGKKVGGRVFWDKRDLEALIDSL